MLLYAVITDPRDLEKAPHLKNLEYGDFNYRNGHDNRLYSINSMSMQITEINVERIIYELSDKQLKELIDWLMAKVNPIEDEQEKEENLR